MQILFIIIALIVIAIIVIYYKKNNLEGFYDKMRPYRHARLNEFNGLEWVDDLPPCAKGEKSCGVIPCPSVFKDDIICWKCWEQEVEPQNMLGEGYDG